MAQFGSDCCTVTQVDVERGNLLKRSRRKCFPIAGLDGSLMAASCGKDKEAQQCLPECALSRFITCRPVGRSSLTVVHYELVAFFKEVDSRNGGH
jgi:hypothetical protein